MRVVICACESLRGGVPQLFMALMDIQVVLEEPEARADSIVGEEITTSTLRSIGRRGTAVVETYSRSLAVPLTIVVQFTGSLSRERGAAGSRNPMSATACPRPATLEAHRPDPSCGVIPVSATQPQRATTRSLRRRR